MNLSSYHISTIAYSGDSYLFGVCGYYRYEQACSYHHTFFKFRSNLNLLKLISATIIPQIDLIRKNYGPTLKTQLACENFPLLVFTLNM